MPHIGVVFFFLKIISRASSRVSGTERRNKIDIGFCLSSYYKAWDHIHLESLSFETCRAGNNLCP